MTIWQPSIADRNGPRYLAIADALAEDVATGILEPGTRLPTHRDLAYRLGVTVGTVSRAYAEADRRGLISGEVGRGTFVGNHSKASRLVVPPDQPSGIVDLSLNLPAYTSGDIELSRTLAEVSRDGGLLPLLDYQPDVGLPHHRAAGAKWLAHLGVPADASRIVVTNGAQHAMAVTFLAVARPGDVVLTEALTYPGMKELANQFGLRLHGVAMDGEGMRADAFAEACRTLAPKALYTTPTLQNPTAVLMGEQRRREIVAIARAHNVTIVEDDVYGFLLGGIRPPAMADLAPDIVYHITGLSKCLFAGLRVGYVLCPAGTVERVGSAVRATCRMATPLMAEVATRWIENGTAARLAESQRDEERARREIAMRVLKDIPCRTHPASFHLWISLPESWRAGEFVDALKSRGVIVLPADAFAVGRAQSPHAVRVCLGAARTRDAIEAGLNVIAETLADQSRCATPAV